MLEQQIASQLSDCQHFFMIKPHWRERKPEEPHPYHKPRSLLEDVYPLNEEQRPAGIRISVEFMG